jgi:hypothetical protein
VRRKLRLGPIPKATPVKITIVVTSEFKTQLDRYAEMHARAWGDRADVADLIPHMLRSFVEGDKVFRRASRGSTEPVDSGSS